MLRVCGDVPDHWKEYVRPHHVRGKWAQNKSYETIYGCMAFVQSSYYLAAMNIDLMKCPLPCREVIFGSTIEPRERQSIDSGITRSIVEVKFQSKRVTEITEVPVYTSDDFLSDVGSWLGLLVGMSFLSVVEVITFLFLAAVEKLAKLHK